MRIKIRTDWRKKGRTTYLGHWTRLTLAVISSHLIITHEEPRTLKKLFFQPYYYISLAISSLIAYGLIALVIRISRGLDFYYPWGRSFRSRFFRQVILGIFSPVLPAVSAAGLYFFAYDISIFDTVYFSRYLQQIIFLLAALNGYLFYFWVYQQRNKKILRANFTGAWSSGRLTDYSGIAYIYTSDKAYFSVDFIGEKLSWPDSMSKTLEKLPPQHFVMLRQDIIVNRTAIADVVLSRKGQISVILIGPLGKTILVSQRNQVYFKQWFHLPNDLSYVGALNWVSLRSC